MTEGENNDVVVAGSGSCTTQRQDVVRRTAPFSPVSRCCSNQKTLRNWLELPLLRISAIFLDFLVRVSSVLVRLFFSDPDTDAAS